uniref:Uncharacterized protein n=1 Tax=Peronospora matthiolae TaxID=2874970 RepID=A0AAV1TQZ6_9STRA
MIEVLGLVGQYDAAHPVPQKEPPEKVFLARS